MNQHPIPDTVLERIEEMRGMLLESKLLRQTGRPILASILDDEAVAYRNKTIELVENYQQLGMMGKVLPKFVQICLGLRSEVESAA